MFERISSEKAKQIAKPFYKKNRLARIKLIVKAPDLIAYNYYYAKLMSTTIISFL